MKDDAHVDAPGSPSAIDCLRHRYADREAAIAALPRPLAGVTSNTVPWELLEAAGYAPVVLSPPPGPTPTADACMEDVFDARIRGIFDRLLTGAWPGMDLVVIPRTSEQEHKLFLYLKEVVRHDDTRTLPRAILYNLLHAQSPEAREYGLDRTHALIGELPGFDPTRLPDAIARGNAARAVIRRLQSLRETRLTGAEALPLIGASYFMDRGEFAQLASAAADEIGSRAPLDAPHVIVKGTPLDHPHLHAAIETHGLIVSAEDDWWGARAAGSDIVVSGDPIVAVFEKYYLDAPSPRVFPPAAADAWFHDQLSRANGVVFYLPPEDDVLGWDYPRWRSELERRGLPHVLIREDAAAGDVSAACHDALERFARAVRERR